jgi:hypothetical protein
MIFQRVGARQRIENQRKVLPILLPQNPMPVLPANLRLKESSPRRKPLLRDTGYTSRGRLLVSLVTTSLQPPPPTDWNPVSLRAESIPLSPSSWKQFSPILWLSPELPRITLSSFAFRVQSAIPAARIARV